MTLYQAGLTHRLDMAMRTGETVLYPKHHQTVIAGELCMLLRGAT